MKHQEALSFQISLGASGRYRTFSKSLRCNTTKQARISVHKAWTSGRFSKWV